VKATVDGKNLSVNVIDETPPVLELNPGVDTLVAGKYEIIYSATDSSDNEGQVSRFVVVMDQE